jgi:hypothetical protein
MIWIGAGLTRGTRRARIRIVTSRSRALSITAIIVLVVLGIGGLSLATLWGLWRIGISSSSITAACLGLVSWCLWAISLALFACVVDPLAGILGYILLLICVGISIRHHKGLITVLLIASLIPLFLES